ncbi:MAG: DUF447 family protein [Candidatus Bathyarchaeota archaeon]|nr:DUF447 family protein [Candidatus Bathyarchaeota archaeon]
MTKKWFIKFGLTPDSIFEAIVSTYNPDGSCNAAPMGIIVRKDGMVLIRPYTHTQTYKNLRYWRCCTINFTWKPEVFLKTTFKHVKGIRIPSTWFENSRRIHAPVLRVADGYVEARVLRFRVYGDRGRFLCKVLASKTRSQPPLTYFRAIPAIIESIIHATRILKFKEKGENGKVEELLKIVNHYDNLVRRVTSKSSLVRIMEELKKILGK